MAPSRLLKRFSEGSWTRYFEGVHTHIVYTHTQKGMPAAKDVRKGIGEVVHPYSSMCAHTNLPKYRLYSQKRKLLHINVIVTTLIYFHLLRHDAPEWSIMATTPGDSGEYRSRPEERAQNGCLCRHIWRQELYLCNTFSCDDRMLGCGVYWIPSVGRANWSFGRGWQSRRSEVCLSGVYS